jgi:hypothetical protein
MVINPSIHLPYILNVPRPTTCKNALNLELNKEYHLFAETANAFYRFVLEEEAGLTVHLTNFVANDGQLQVLMEPGEQCSGLLLVEYVPDTTSDMMVNVDPQQPGVYYVFIFNADDQPSLLPYSLMVETK